MSKTTLFTVFRHMIPDYTKSLLTEVHKGVFMNEIDYFGTYEVNRVSIEIKYGVQVKTSKMQMRYNSEVILRKINDFLVIKNVLCLFV